MHDKVFTLGPTPNTVRCTDGSILTAPDGWILFPPGDAALTRRVKEAGSLAGSREEGPEGLLQGSVGTTSHGRANPCGA